MLFALIVLSACSKQDGQPEAAADFSTQGAAISLRNVYSMSLGAAHLLTISELQNTGKVGITAFQGQLTIKDDLDNILEDSEVRFTSDTPYFTAEGIKSSHVIFPGANILIINRTTSTEAEQVLALDKWFATDKENLM